MKNDLMAEAKLHDVDPFKGRVGVEGGTGGTGGWGSCRSEEVRRHSSNCHNLSVTCRMCVNVDPETAQPPPPTSYASFNLNLYPSSTPSPVTTHWAGIYGNAVGQLSLIFIMSHACTVSS